MAFARTVATTHTKTLISPSTGTADKVYGEDYVAADSHSSTGSVAGADVGGIPYCPTATTETTSSGLTFNGTNLVSLFKATGVGTAAAPPFWIPDAVGAAGMWQRTSGTLGFAMRGVHYVEMAADGT